MGHPLSPAPLSPRHRDGALRPGQFFGGGVVPGIDTPGLRHAEGLRAAHQAARGGRQVLRPVVGQASSVCSVDAYLIDSANPDTETKLDASYPEGLAFGKDYATDRKTEIIFKLNPLVEHAASHYYVHWLALRATIEVVNRGTEAAELNGKLHLRELDDISDKWATLPVTWNNRESGWTTEELWSVNPEFNELFVNNNVGGGTTGYDEEYPQQTSIVPGGKYTYTEELTYEFAQDLDPLTDETRYWNSVNFDATLPEIGWALKWSYSQRYYVPGEDEGGWPIQINDQFLDINCKFYGYKFFMAGVPWR
jgi:hypothetical protein